MEKFRKRFLLKKESLGIYCDTCDGQCSYDHKELTLIENGETNRYDFCSYKCLWKFVTNEIHKENPRPDIEFGKEK